MDKTYELPSDAVPYILLQRMNTQKFRNLRYMLPYGRTLYNAIYNNFLYQAEASLRENEIKDQYLSEMKDEFNTIKDHLPDRTTSILDVGCGVGGIDLFLSDFYEDSQPIFYLFDKTEVSSSVYYQFKDEAAFYNSLDVAARALKQNGVNEKNLYTLDADDFDLTELKDVDLCISLISWAFHYPLDTYLNDVVECLAEDGSLLLDFRKGPDSSKRPSNTLRSTRSSRRRKSTDGPS
ncbi:MAG: class I SAM-dependent methyltransferase [bacterium]